MHPDVKMVWDDMPKHVRTQEELLRWATNLERLVWKNKHRYPYNVQIEQILELACMVEQGIDPS